MSKKKQPKFSPVRVPVELTSVRTSDGIDLNGVVVEPRGRKRAMLIWVHGLTSSFDGGQKLMRELSRACVRQGIGYCKFNTRGHHLVDYGRSARTRQEFIGASHERFTDAVKDLQAVVALAVRLGYRRIILAGHSTGAQKVLYYVAKTHDRRIRGLILAGPASDIAGELQHIRPATLRRRLAYARRRMRAHPHELVPAAWGPWSVQRYVSLFTPGSVEETFPYHHLGGRWTYLRNLRLPVLMVSGSLDQYLDRPAREIMEIFRSQAKNTSDFTGRVIPGATHGFHRHQQQLTAVIDQWLRHVV